ncbi:membrane metalloprotease [Nonlabens xiamenensis]|uniref:membrane metalloprotease n=1 Tax=Nonlabens xiamenensis TaxID=2341043 RepID=UPI000F607BE4|nr:membrane metalloprotease [Nonlabens xiamenensis]
MKQIKNLLAIVVMILSLSACSESDSGDDGAGGNGGNGVNANNRTTGASANELLSDQVFEELVIEAVYEGGSRPEAASLNNLVSFLNDRLNKPAGIRIVEREIPAQNNGTYTIDEVIEVEDEFRTQFNSDNSIAVFVLFTDEASANDEGNRVTLGTAYKNTSLVIFQPTIEMFSGGLGQPGRVTTESAVYQHEFGHIMGLVNLGTPLQSQHEDPDNSRHCNVDGCLMAAELEGGNITDMMGLMGSGIPALDAECIADLQANGGK